jgi:hypothetical protein
MILWEAAKGAPVAARVAVAGDFLPAWKFAAEKPQLKTGDRWREMAEGLSGYFEDVAICFVNCECMLESAGLEPRPLDGLGDIVSAPRGCLDYLAAIRASAVGIANNHAYDFGIQGVERTRRAIVNHRFTPLGAGRNLAAPPEILVWQGPGPIRVGFWAAASATPDPSTRTFAGVEPATLQRAQQALQAMKKQDARFCVALLHAGCLRTNYIAPEDTILMDSLARAGFDLVAASHSHRISGAKSIQTAKNHPAYCFYGLGSIVSGFVASALEREGLIVVAGFAANAELVRIEAKPVQLACSGFGTIPSPAAGGVLMGRFRHLSEQIADGSFARLFYREVSPGLLRLYTRDIQRAFQEAGVRGVARKARRIRLRHVRRLLHSVLR